MDYTPICFVIIVVVTDESTEAARIAYKLAKVQHQLAVESHLKLDALLKTSPNNADVKVAEAAAKKARTVASKEASKTKASLDDKLQRHNARNSSLSQKFEAIYKKNGITREHYHGGKFNGVNCIRIMEKAKEIFLGDDNKKGGFLEACLNQKLDKK